MAKKGKKPIGRPRSRHPYSEQLGVALRPHQKDRYIQAADAEQLELSEWVRKVLDAAADEVLNDDADE